MPSLSALLLPIAALAAAPGSVPAAPQAAGPAAPAAGTITADQAKAMSCAALGEALTRSAEHGMASYAGERAASAELSKQYGAMTGGSAGGMASSVLSQLGPVGSAAAYAVNSGKAAKQKKATKEAQQSGAAWREALAANQAAAATTLVLWNEWNARPCEDLLPPAEQTGGSMPLTGSPPTSAAARPPVTALPSSPEAMCAGVAPAARKACEKAVKRNAEAH